MTGTITNQGITIRQGDSFPIKLYFKTQNGAKDISGSSVLMQVRDDKNKIVLEKEGLLEDAINGDVLINLTADDTSISVGEYKTDIQITDKHGHVNTVYPQNVNTVAFFKITSQVTDTSE